MSPSVKEVLGSRPLRFKSKRSIMFCISGRTLSLIAELIALFIRDCTRSISECISRETPAFISSDNMLIDSENSPCLISSFLFSISLISFSSDGFSLLGKDCESCCPSAPFIMLSFYMVETIMLTYSENNFIKF